MYWKEDSWKNCGGASGVNCGESGRKGDNDPQNSGEDCTSASDCGEGHCHRESLSRIRSYTMLNNFKRNWKDRIETRSSKNLKKNWEVSD